LASKSCCSKTVEPRNCAPYSNRRPAPLGTHAGLLSNQTPRSLSSSFRAQLIFHNSEVPNWEGGNPNGSSAGRSSPASTASCTGTVVGHVSDQKPIWVNVAETPAPGQRMPWSFFRPHNVRLFGHSASLSSVVTIPSGMAAARPALNFQCFRSNRRRLPVDLHWLLAIRVAYENSNCNTSSFFM